MMWISLLPMALLCCGQVQWAHPAGIVSAETITDVQNRVATLDWAAALLASRKEALRPWVEAPPEELARVFPKTRGNVYHNFSCPQDRHRLNFDPFEPDTYTCPSCGKRYPADTDAGIYPEDDRYHGTMRDGWECLFYQRAGSVAQTLGLLARLEPDASQYTARGIAILMLFAQTIEGLKTDLWDDPERSRILTYHREGDNKILNDLGCAYELLRDAMTVEQRARFQTSVLERMLNDIMLEPVYRYNHNNVYQWYRTVLQVGLCLEREDLIDWSFGYGSYSPEALPEHMSIQRIIDTHFKPDGAFWELCSGYHLYPMHSFCEIAVLTRNLSRMDPIRFPPERYDLTRPDSPGGRAIKNALEWFVSMAMPDRSMPVMGDSTISRADMADYQITAEVGYRFFDVLAVGDYARLRNNQRSWEALLYGAPQIVQHELPYTSSFLSSGWVSLRNEWQGNRVWAGLNALIQGGGHQHADRLTLVTYAHGELLALEKATPYNESTTRMFGRMTPSHNTVTVDRASSVTGHELTPEETPLVACFFPARMARFAELHGDQLYPQCRVYRRSVALLEDVLVDCFDVQGGATHDWMVHHAGPAPVLSIETVDATFEPEEWLYNGTDQIRKGAGDVPWDARWTVNGVTSRLAMLPAGGTEVFALETYPTDNAFITENDPPCQTLCVRRYDDTPFVAVWDAWKESPNLTAITPGSGPKSVKLDTQSNVYYLVFGGDAVFPDGVTLATDGAFAVYRVPNALLFASGTYAAISTPEGALRVSSDGSASVSAEYADGVASLEVSGDIQYDTWGGVDHYREPPAVSVTIEGALWKIDRQQRRDGPQPRSAQLEAGAP